jgi:alanine racemase
MVDVSALASVGAGEEVLLMGRDGEQEIGAWELAQKSGTIPWEIFTGLGRRVVRVGIGAV